MKIYFTVERWADPIEEGFKSIGVWWVCEEKFHLWYLPEYENRQYKLGKYTISQYWLNEFHRLKVNTCDWHFLFGWLGGEGQLTDRNGVFVIELETEPTGEELLKLFRSGDKRIEGTELADRMWLQRTNWMASS